MKFEVINTAELLQFIKDYNVDVEKSKLHEVLKTLNDGTHKIQDTDVAKSNGTMIFLVCNKENGGITMKNFIVKLREINETIS
jgi:hypothetical protein